MGITTATKMKLSLLLLSAATANEFDCYTCGFDSGNGLFKSCDADWNTSNSEKVKCNDTNGKHCFTAQTTDKNGNKTYKRGCQQTDMYAGFEKGCIDKKEGSVCYQGCTSKECNTHTNLNSSSATVTGSILAAIFYMMMGFHLLCTELN